MEDNQEPEEWSVDAPRKLAAIVTMVAASWALVIGIYLLATRHW